MKTKYREFKVQSLTHISNQICQLSAKNFWAKTEIIYTQLISQCNNIQHILYKVKHLKLKLN
jgi:hypothetical protein